MPLIARPDRPASPHNTVRTLVDVSDARIHGPCVTLFKHCSSFDMIRPSGSSWHVRLLILGYGCPIIVASLIGGSPRYCRAFSDESLGCSAR